MLKEDLARARAAWIAEARTEAERTVREEASFLVYRDESGRCADFHALRHTFITRLVRSGVKPKEAQTLARHSTITLTMDRYAHTGLHDVAAAVESLSSLPLSGPQGIEPALRATGTDGQPAPSACTPACTELAQAADSGSGGLTTIEAAARGPDGEERGGAGSPNPLILQPFASDCERLRAAEKSGEGGIRTLGRIAPTPVFETGPIGRSGTSPRSLPFVGPGLPA